ncbi:hypothetical protein OY671_009101, partial [Metschnikowia pulcherrima]
MGISDVLRGEDHVSNTATQIQMFGASGAEPPRFAHAASSTGTEGKLSKRSGSSGVADSREAGIEPEASIAMSARSGTSDPIDPASDADASAAAFDLSRFGRAPARFDDAESHRINAAVVHRSPFARVAHLSPEGMTEVAWEAIRPNSAHIGEAADWWRVVTGPITAPEADPETRAFLDQAATVAAVIDWASDPWSALTATLKDATGRKGKASFSPSRQ